MDSEGGERRHWWYDLVVGPTQAAGGLAVGVTEESENKNRGSLQVWSWQAPLMIVGSIYVGDQERRRCSG